MKQPPLLLVRGLSKVYESHRHRFRPTVGVTAVKGVSFQIERGQTMALVGESGSGKTTVALCLLRIIRSTSGEAWLDGTNLFALRPGEMRLMRRRMQVVFQEPLTSLDPELMVGDIVAEGLDALALCSSRTERADRIAEGLRKVQLGAEVARRRPSELSGGQRQRVGIARALVLGPQIVICDEPTSSLDLSVQAQIVNLLRDLQNELGVSYLFITHDLALAYQCAHTIAVMSQGQLVEQGPADTVFADPQHAYTRQLLQSVRGH